LGKEDDYSVLLLFGFYRFIHMIGSIKSSNLTIAGRTLIWGSRTYVMAVVNITPDSFSGDGFLKSDKQIDQKLIDLILEQARIFVNAGADILDVGGESTRPGSQSVSADEELERVLPVIQRLSAELDVLISIDTYKAAVAENALEAGAHLVNDVWSLHADPDLAAVIARHRVPAILMHNRSSWVNAQIKEHLGGRYVGVPYDNLLEDVRNELLESVAIAHSAGIPDEHVILDPGIGFGKTTEQNLELLDRLDEIRSLGYPVLLGPSRKSFIGYTLDLPPDQRVEGTAAAVAVGITRGADIIRVHDVEFMLRVARMTDAIVRRYN
jgi:dihydropteroate synthase